MDHRHARLAALLREAKRRAEFDRLGEYGPRGSFQPTPKQLLFHNVGGEPGVRHRCLAAANQCITGTTLIETTEGPRPIAGLPAEGGFYVHSWDGERECAALVSRVFLKGIAPTYKVHLGNNQAFECSYRHQVYADGKFLSLGHLVHTSNAYHYRGASSSWLASYGRGSYLRDGLLPLYRGIFLEPLPLPGDVHLCSQQGHVLEGVEAPTPGHNHICPACALLAIAGDDPVQLLDLCGQWEAPTAYKTAQHSFSILRALVQSRSALPLSLLTSEERDYLELLAYRDCWFPSGHASLRVGGRSERIIAITPSGVKPIFDLEVPGTNCYFASGILHHNSGKTTTAAFEVAMHLTGRYPDWWHGYRFKGPIKAWVSGVTSETTRDTCQALLLGEKRAWGTGTVPRDALYGDPAMARSVADAVDSFQARHVSGGVSTCWFKSYDRGREKWQGATLHLIWYDEEPPEDIYSEGQTRLNRHRGPSMMTFTPLKGMTEVVRKFFDAPKADDPLAIAAAQERRLILMDLNDATFYTPEEMAAIEAAYPEHERRARARGLPIIGEGLIYPVARSEITCDPFPLPAYYRRICGLDFGLSHPTAAAWIAHDPDTDTIYVYDGYKQIDPLYTVHTSALRSRGTKVPIAWPHDGLKRDPHSGVALAELYRAAGLPNMLPESARYDTDKGGRQPVEPVIADILGRMRAGKFKVFSPLTAWFDEQSRYHRKDGKPVDYDDDLMSATHYAVMELRSARPLEQSTFFPAAYGHDPLDLRA